MHKNIWKNSNIKISPVQRRANHVADSLVIQLHSLMDELVGFSQPPIFCMNLLWQDFIGVSLPCAFRLQWLWPWFSLKTLNKISYFDKVTNS